MKTFKGFKSFAKELQKIAVKEVVLLQVGLDKVGKLVEKSAKAEIGHLQPAVGPFPKWDELAESTKADKVKKGYWFNDDYNPLLRTGELHDSISHQVKPLEVQIGSTSDIMVYQEFGTGKIPARPVLGPAAFKNKEKIRAILGAAAVSGLIGADKIHESLGYNFDTEG
jgi:HK97 gp10 family phage protein